MILTDQPGAGELADDQCLVHPDARQGSQAGGLEKVLKFFDWAFKTGQKSAIELDYVPLPAATVTLIGAEWKEDHRRRRGCVLATR